jgi:hypothetical protein
MKKPLTMPEEAQPRNITRADVLMTEGFGLEVDGRMKEFPDAGRRAEKRIRPQNQVSHASGQGV